MTFISILRPKQYIKNGFILFPVFFGGEFFNSALFLPLFLAVFAFSLCSSSIYILNDIIDVNEDKLHPTKKNRAIASGLISTKDAWLYAAAIGLLGLMIMYFVNIRCFYILYIYLIINTFYSVKLKHIAIVDVLCISIGFVLRLEVGSTVTHIPLTMWIVVITFLLTLFMGFGKRREDLLLYLDKGQKTRKNIDGYNLEFLNFAIGITAACVILGYILYTISPEVIARLHNHNFYLTSAFVILGILRYIQIITSDQQSTDPSIIIYQDRIIQLTLVLWLLSCAYFFYP
jgi:decaprenyl-phosphate phosphoribosyltransferase